MAKHDKIERSHKRGGYRPANGKNRRTAWDTIRLVLSCLLCVICYPLGLVALWTCRQSVGVKLLLTVVTAILFFMVLGWAITIDTGIPFITELQKMGQRWLNTLSDTISVQVIRFKAFTQNVPGVYLQIKEMVPSFSDVLRFIAETIRPLETWLREGRPDDFDMSDYEVAPENSLATVKPTATNAIKENAEDVKPEATQKPEVGPTVTPDADPNAAVYMDKDAEYFHNIKDCDNVVETITVKRSIAMMRGAKECPVCYAGN